MLVISYTCESQQNFGSQIKQSFDSQIMQTFNSQIKQVNHKHCHPYPTWIVLLTGFEQATMQ